MCVGGGGGGEEECVGGGGGRGGMHSNYRQPLVIAHYAYAGKRHIN